ncbi:MAG TPA: deoxyribodipyrimidine photo-lyase [Acidimicrobiia bacterium]|nr:deoxyribodipyrimidine photo-lyase [Acidimicrobiia bacterium]
MSRGVVWFRSDLRLADNPAWARATADHDDVTALFVVDPALWNRAGEHRRNQLAAHLGALDAALAEAGGRLRVERGRPADVVAAIAAGADAVHANSDVTPYAMDRDREAAGALDGRLVAHDGRFVHAPGTILTKDGRPYLVFTPFSRTWQATPRSRWPEPGAARVSADPGTGVPEAGPPLMPGGEAAALDRLDGFAERVDAYVEERDRPDLDTTSRLSADLKFGTVSPRTVADRVGDSSDGRRAFVRQLCWRDFYAQLMARYPHTVSAAMRPEYDAVAWRTDPGGLAAWQEGRTGYPIVDAGMRQLATEGWMHNRVRMITASFLVKDLLVDWRKGERWFRRLLVDADVPQNVGNWQWVAGTGADAAPYFRIFNPVSQSKKFDPTGGYIRRWVPELAGLDDRSIHAPWEAGPLDLAAGGVTLGEDYPAPIVDHAEARELTLAAYKAARSASDPGQ